MSAATEKRAPMRARPEWGLFGSGGGAVGWVKDEDGRVCSFWWPTIRAALKYCAGVLSNHGRDYAERRGYVPVRDIVDELDDDDRTPTLTMWGEIQ